MTVVEFNHYSVMLHETIEQLNINPDGIYVDGTLGGGGHAYEVCSRLKNGHFYGIDQDDAAIAAASARLQPFGDKVTVIRNNYVNAVEALREYGVTGVDGIVLDLGVSSYQLDTEDRGFSYRFDAPLDMRMDRRQTLTARDIVNNYSEMELYHIIKAAVPAKMRQNGHPSKQTFQAIRIECNQELEVLKKALDELIDLLNPGGRFCIITFHSLEDRIVKNAFRRNENPCTCPPEFPVCVCGKVSKGKVITRKPILPSVEELEVNSRSKSAKLRVFEKK